MLVYITIMTKRVYYHNLVKQLRFSCLNFGFTAQAADGEVRKEPLLVLSNGSMASSYAGEAGA